MELSVIYTLAAGLFAGGAAWGGSKAALNGTRARVKEMQADLKAHVASDAEVQSETIDRLARIETKLDMLNQRGR